MPLPTEMQVNVPAFVRIKPGALGRIGLYLKRHGHHRPALLISEGLPADLIGQITASLTDAGITVPKPQTITDASFETATATFAAQPNDVDAILGLGGGRAIDAAKFVAHLAGKPFYALPTSLSNDGFASPQASLTVGGVRRSLPTATPAAVVIDTSVCLNAPRSLWLSGIGDLVAKLTAVRDWKIAYHATGESVNDFAALLSDASVHQFLSQPTHDTEGLKLLATALLLNGVSMALCGSSRPASGSEHLISHALDAICSRPKLHGLQVGLATYIVSQLQDGPSRTERIAAVFDTVGFWSEYHTAPALRSEWLQAVKQAPGIKPDRYTVLSTRDCAAEVAALIDTDPRLKDCFET